MNLLCKCSSSRLIKAGETVDERIIDAPGGRTAEKGETRSVQLTKLYSIFRLLDVPDTAPSTPYRTLSA